MPVFQKNQFPLWGIWKIEESWEEMLCLLDMQEEYLSFLKSYKSKSRKAEWLAVRLLLKELLGVETTIAYHTNGVPYLTNFPFHISISHTKGYAAILLSVSKPVGIDIEYCSERIHSIKSRFLNEKELELLGGNVQTNDLLVCWSAKETVFKMMEQQTADMQNDIHILEFDFLQNEGSLIVRGNLTQQPVTFEIIYTIASDFVLTRSKG